MSNNESNLKAFDFASDTTKQLINISTGIIALMVTFSKDILGNATVPNKTLLVITWGFYLISIILGILTLMALTGTLQPKLQAYTTQTIDININNSNIRLFSSLQIIFFIIAIILTIIFGYHSLNSNNNNKNIEKGKYQIVRKTILNNDSATIYIDTLYLGK